MPILKYTHPGLACYALHYIDNNDYAHRRDHIYSVLEHCAGIAERYNLNPATLEVAAIVHDMFSGRSREFHHGDAARFARDALPFLYGYSYEFAEEVTDMCLDHRASTKSDYRSLQSMAFSAADRGPLDLAQSLVRGLGRQTICRSSLLQYVEKLRDKFGPAGYARTNQIHDDYFKGCRERYWEQLNLPIEKIYQLWEAEVQKTPPVVSNDVLIKLGNSEEFNLSLRYRDESNMTSVITKHGDTITYYDKYSEPYLAGKEVLI